MDYSASKKRRLYNSYQEIPQIDLNQSEGVTVLIAVLLKIVEEIRASTASAQEQSDKLERKIEALNKKVDSVSRVSSVITRLDHQIDKLTKEISDLQIHALNGFTSLDSNSPYTHY